MLRFQIIDASKDFMDLMLKFLKQENFKEVYGMTGGDDDFICIDTLRKEWCYCENGFMPFCNHDEMMKYQFKGKDFKLSDLVNMRY